ncbi:MAG TPA: OmpA family protein [Bryobacteraceae bacterium]|nr:OmpA family protein [Bryobacteraceae bacterium]
MRSRFLIGAVAAAVCLMGVGCKKKPVAKNLPPPPPPVEQARANTPPPERVATVTHQPAAPAEHNTAMPNAETRARIQELLDRIQDAYFDYDKHAIRPDAETALKADAQTLTDIIKQYPNFKLTVEGFCDERGSEEYNVALGDARAKQTKEFLVGLGLPDQQLAVISYGKDKPVCTDHDESCWQKNRRAHITQAGNS